MKKLLMLAALAAIAAGCSVTKINYKKDADGVCEYRIYHNDHWLKRDTGAMSGGMSKDGKFEVKLESATVSPSEEKIPFCRPRPLCLVVSIDSFLKTIFMFLKNIMFSS